MVIQIMNLIKEKEMEQEYDTYEEVINGQIVQIKVLPSADEDFKWEYAHENLTQKSTQFKEVLSHYE